MMRFVLILGISISLASCSMLPESWNIESWSAGAESESSTPVVFADARGVDFASIEVGQTKTEVLEILGPSVQVDDGRSLAEHYIKGGEVYDVLYFRGAYADGEDLRAYLFREDRLVGIGWSSVE